MRSDARKSGRRKSTLGVVLVVAVVSIWLVWWQWDAIGELFGGADRAPGAAIETDAGAQGEAPGAAPAASEAPPPPAAASAWVALTGRAPSWPADLNAPTDCAEVEAELARICAALDKRDYIDQARITGGSCGLVLDVAVELARRPPDPSSELKSYDTMLSNVFHLFRVTGRERLDLLRRAVREEQELAEPLALALYRWTISRERCARSGATPIRGDALYAYAGFLFQTMGGQAYLRRRSPRVEALVSLYALLILDRAEQAGRNPLGLDVLPEIPRTRELVAGQSFVFEDRYLELLDAMERRRESRATSR